MKIFYSQTTGSAYFEGIHNTMPEDVVEITQEIYDEVIGNPAPGKMRAHDENGIPYLVDIPAEEIDDAIAFSARVKRNDLLRDVYDRGLMMAQRALRMTDPADQQRITYLNDKIAQLDQYAEALQAVPEQPGFPQSISWPTIPTP